MTLPTTAFSLRANSVVREPQIQAWWDEQAVYRSLVDSNPGVSCSAVQCSAGGLGLAPRGREGARDWLQGK